MKLQDLIDEGNVLSRTATLLKLQGEYIAGRWYKTAHSRAEVIGKQSLTCWLSLDSYFIPDLGHGVDGKLTVFASNENEFGKVAVTNEYSDREGVELYSEEVEMPAPPEAIQRFGSKTAQEWLSQRASARKAKLIDQYEDHCLQTHPMKSEENVFAYAAGWPTHFPGSLSWDEMSDMILCLTTLKHSEPWLEVWQTSSGQFRVVQHVS